MFLGVLRRSPPRALAIAYWYATRRRVRARNRLRAAAAELLPVYETWMRTVERPETVALLAQARADGHAERPTFAILLHAPDWPDRPSLDRAIASLAHQTCRDWEAIVTGPSHARPPESSDAIPLTYLTVADEPGAGWRAALAMARSDFVIVARPDDVFPDWALACYQQAALRHPGTDILYGDEDVIDAAGRRSRPWFKPRWNSELVLALDYVSHACAIATSLARAASHTTTLDDGDGYAVVLVASARPDVAVRHLAAIVRHRHVEAMQDDQPMRLRAVSRFVADRGGVASAGPFGTITVRWPLPDPAPSVTIIVPTRDRVDLLAACIGSVLRQTQYPDFDVLIVDNGSVEPATFDWFAGVTVDRRVSVLRYDRPYNYSAINNFAVTHARGRYLCLLNNDTEVTDSAWLCEMMRHATRADVGAVGAKLLYADGSIQHAGVVIGLGNAAGHAHRALPGDAPGYFAQAHATHNASAVTAACLVVERAKFDAVGGLDEADLQIAYNDVDLCLKLQAQGWRNVYAASAALVHHESKSRGLDLSPVHLERYMSELKVLQQRWNTTEVIDPMHHPRLDRSSETYRIRL